MTESNPTPPPSDSPPPAGNVPPPAGATPPPVGNVPPPGGPVPESGSQDARNLAMLAHILNVIFLVPLLVYLLKKDSDPFLNDQSKEALNFSLSCLIVHIICSVTAMLCVPVLVSLALVVVQIVLGIIGGLKARDGIAYRYPLKITLIK